MRKNNTKLDKIKEIIERYLFALDQKPRVLGSIDEIESSFFWLDQIILILTYGPEYNYDELSWRRFLSFKKIGGPNENAAKTIKKNNNPYKMLSDLRKEYDEWINMKLSHKNNPVDSPLIKLLEKADNRKAYELLSWFSKYPSKRVINIYSDRIKNRYTKFPEIAKSLARMGDDKIIAWAIKYLNRERYPYAKKLALECIGCSPLAEVDNIIKKIIRSKNENDIDCLVCAFGNSANKNKFKWLKQIIVLPNRSRRLHSSIELILRVLLHENKDKSLELLNEIHALQPDEIQILGKA